MIRMVCIFLFIFFLSLYLSFHKFFAAMFESKKCVQMHAGEIMWPTPQNWMTTILIPAELSTRMYDLERQIRYANSNLLNLNLHSHFCSIRIWIGCKKKRTHTRQTRMKDMEANERYVKRMVRWLIWNKQIFCVVGSSESVFEYAVRMAWSVERLASNDT